MTEEREEYLDNLACLSDAAENAVDVEHAIQDVANYDKLSAKRARVLEDIATQFSDARQNLLDALSEHFEKDLEKANDR